MCMCSISPNFRLCVYTHVCVCVPRQTSVSSAYTYACVCARVYVVGGLGGGGWYRRLSGASVYGYDGVYACV